MSKFEDMLDDFEDAAAHNGAGLIGSPDVDEARKLVLDAFQKALYIIEGFGHPGDEIYCGVCYTGPSNNDVHDSDCAVLLADAFLKEYVGGRLDGL